MPEQPELFETKRTGRVDPETGRRIRQPVAPSEPEAVRPDTYDGDPEPIHPDRYEAMMDALSGTRKRYYDLLRRIAAKGYRVRSGPDAGTTIHSLTDREAAAFLGVERTTICGRRNELMGGSGGDVFEDHPVVEKAGGRRMCHMRPDGPDVFAYRARLDLYATE